ncbi:MAG: hypothetical protein AVO33_06820 [delta proteobacterium ML8_F1]|nr:MAG: hypothetical protein AVO33_06820 [delta proteobacterium ML8_F1]
MGVFLMLLSSLFFTLSTFFGKLVANTTEMDAIITSFVRYFLGMLGLAVYMRLKGISFRPVKAGPVIIRSLLNASALILLTGSLNFTTITNANMIHLTYPVFVFLFARFITGEKLRPIAFFYLFLILVGTYVVSEPNLDHINVGDLISFASAIFAGLAILYLTEARRTDSTITILFYLMFIGTLISFPLIVKDLKYIAFDSSGIVLLAAGAGFLGQLFTTEGFKYVDSPTGSILSSSRMIMAAILGYLFLSEPLNLRIILGITLILAALVGVSGYGGVLREKFMGKEPEKAARAEETPNG